MEPSRILRFALFAFALVISTVGHALGAVAKTGKHVVRMATEIGPKPMPISRAKAFLRSMPEQWRGVPYRFGGTSRRGIDCSAFVQAVMDQVFDVEIPRSTVGQASVGVRVSKSELKPGDLILFYSRYSGSRRHVGIYVGDNEFLHISSTRNRVVIDNLDRYDNSPGLSFLQARRVVNLEEDNPEVLPADENPIAIPMISTKVMQRVVMAGNMAF